MSRPRVTAVVAALLVLLPLGAASARDAKYGGTLVVGMNGGDVTSLDPTLARDPRATEVLLAMCQRLYEAANNHGRPALVPLLAASQPSISADRLTYTVQLRRGVQFNDGTPLNAAAVVASYERYVTYPGSSRTSDFAAVDRVTASGPSTVVFRLKAPDVTFTPNLYALSPTAVEKQGDGFSANPVCVGPYMLDHRLVGDNVTLVKSPYYYKRGAIHLDKVVFRPMPSSPAAAASLRAGDIQVLDNVDTTELPAVQSSGLRVIPQPELGFVGVFVNLGNRNGAGNPPYANVGTPLASSSKLRQAFEEAIDRAALNRVVFDGRYQPTCTAIPASNTVWYEATRIPCTPFDPAHAKKLVAESGVASPTVHLLVQNRSDHLRAAQFLQAAKKAVGIDVVIDVADATTVATRVTAGDYDATIRGWPGGLDPHDQLKSFFATSGDRNYFGYSSPRMDYVLGNAAKTTSAKARATDYRVAQQIAQTDRPIVYLWLVTRYAAFSPSLSGVQLTPNGSVSVANAQLR